MNIVKENYKNIGSINIEQSTLSISMNDLITNTISISKIILQYSQNLTKTSVDLQNSSINMVYILK
jgi:hypothetical protein